MQIVTGSIFSVGRIYKIRKTAIKQQFKIFTV